ncbi:MAG: DUF2510 domain-containing protein [Bifidobacteriaceae bacterium]|jgi:predicted type IV restriction endonuclease|nr:DUF2510 domain-containing protein [Bifidobacteriaceae bacterium]
MTQPAGWYPDPQDNACVRYWDGDGWTRKTKPANPDGHDDAGGRRDPAEPEPGAADGPDGIGRTDAGQPEPAAGAAPTPRPKRSTPKTADDPPPRAPKWEVEAKDRVRVALRRMAKPIQDMTARDVNEGDTRLLVTDVLCDALGYDKYSELSTEYRVRGDFADYAIRLDGQTVAMVEVKRATTKLSIKHLRQIEMYGVNEGVEWLILTNGGVWQVYRLIPGMPVSVDLVLDVDLLDDSAPLAKKADAMALIAKEFITRGRLEALWKVNAATAPERLVEVLLSEAVLTEARRELKRQTDHRIDDADLGRLIRDTVIRPELA